jgi:hypothetical protein
MTSKTHAALHAARHTAGRAARCCFSEIGLEFCCTSKTHVIAAVGSLHIQTAHRKRKCNRPLISLSRAVYRPRTYHLPLPDSALHREVCSQSKRIEADKRIQERKRQRHPYFISINAKPKATCYLALYRALNHASNHVIDAVDWPPPHALVSRTCQCGY